VAMDKERLTEVVERLKQQRDELRVKAHLGGMDAKEEWSELEGKWEALQVRLGEVKDEATEKARGARAGAEVIAEELGAAYRRIRDRLPKD
jgi:hypothetical protein